MKRILATALALIGLLAGCSPSKESQLTASTTTTATLPPPPIAGVDGRFLSLGGENPLDAGLYELRLWPVRLDPLTPVRRVSSIGACETRVIVAAAQAEVGYNDHLQVFSGGRFGPVENLGSPHAFIPTLAADCRMLYLDSTNPAEGGDARVHLWNPSDRTDTVLATYPGVGAMSWGPSGQFALLERTRSVQGKEQDEVAVHILKNSARRSLSAPAPRLSGLLWGAANWMAFSNGNADATIFLQPDTGERHDLADWAPRAWSPDGKRLLVAAPDRRRLGVVELPDFSTVKPLGEAPFPVHDIVWLPAGSDPVGPIATG
jgi:hypothetical protein